MLSDDKKQKLRGLFKQNGIAWAKYEIRGQKFNKEKRVFLQYLVDEHEQEQSPHTNQSSDDSKPKDTPINWTAISTIATVIIAITGIITMLILYF